MPVCQVCDETFTSPHRRGPVPKYCSPSHRQFAFVARQRAADKARIEQLERFIVDAGLAAPPPDGVVA